MMCEGATWMLMCGGGEETIPGVGIHDTSSLIYLLFPIGNARLAGPRGWRETSVTTSPLSHRDVLPHRTLCMFWDPNLPPHAIKVSVLSGEPSLSYIPYPHSWPLDLFVTDCSIHTILLLGCLYLHPFL